MGDLKMKKEFMAPVIYICNIKSIIFSSDQNDILYCIDFTKSEYLRVIVQTDTDTQTDPGFFEVLRFQIKRWVRGSGGGRTMVVQL